MLFLSPFRLQQYPDDFVYNVFSIMICVMLHYNAPSIMISINITL